MTRDAARYFHCAKCIRDLPAGQSPEEYCRLSVGVTGDGDLFVDCNRHNEVVVAIRNEDLPEAMAELGNAICACGGH